MSEVWLTIGALAVGTFLIKGSGPLVLGARELPARALAVIALLAPALLAALVVVETFAAEDGAWTVDSRALGVGAAALALLARLPMLAVVGVAAVVAAASRALT